MQKNIESNMIFQNVEPKIGRLQHFFVNQYEGRYIYTRGDSELHVCQAETDYVPKHMLKLDLTKSIKIKRDETFREILLLVEQAGFVLIFRQGLNQVTIFSSSEPEYKLALDMDFSAQLGKNTSADDIKFLPISGNLIGNVSFFLLVKSETILRLVKVELQTDYIQKSIQKLKEQNSGSFSQLLPAALKMSVFAVFQIEPNLIHVKAASTTKDKYVLTMQTPDNKTLYVKSISTDLKKLKNENTVVLTNPIHKLDVSNEYPYYITVVDTKKKIIFLTKSGTHICEFDFGQFITGGKVSADLNLDTVEVGCFNLFSNIFVILVDKYIVTSMLSYDETKQEFNLQLITREDGSNDLYYGKFFNSKYESGDKLFKLRNGRFLIKKKDYFVSFEDYFDSKVIKELDSQTKIINNFHFKTFQLRKNVTDIHPLFIFSLIEMNYFATAARIIKKYLSESLEAETPPSGPTFNVDYEDFRQLISEENQPGFSVQNAIEETLPYLAKMKSFTDERSIPLLNGAENLILSELIKVIQDSYNNKRSQDHFGSIFIAQVKLFNLAVKNTAGLTRQKYMRSKEVIWAIHSQQPEALFDVCFPQETLMAPQFMNWENLKRYCVPLWFDDGSKLKSLVEKMALMQYKQTKNPDDVILWYILLDKLPVLLALYKSFGTEKQKMVTFLSNDFKTEKWKTAAVKNAYVLMAKKEFLMSAAFFMLGDAFSDALSVVVNSLADIQLGILMCRIKENLFSKNIDDKPQLKALLENYFVAKGREIQDPWLVSIGYSLLGQHVNSINCFSLDDGSMNKKPDRSAWLEGFSPLPSSLHPSFFVLRKLLLGSFKIKRELEGGPTVHQESGSIFDDFFESNAPAEEKTEKRPAVILVEDFDKMYKNSLYYYLHMGDPLFGLIKVVTYEPKEEDFSDLTKLLSDLYLDQLIFQSIEEADWKDHFPKLMDRVHQMVGNSKVYKTDQAFSYIEDQLTRLKNPKFQVGWLLATGKGEEALKVTEHLSLQVQSLALYLIRSNNFELKAKDTWENIISFAEELSNCLLLLEAKSDMFHRRANRMKKIYSLYLKDPKDLDKFEENTTSASNVMIKDATSLDEYNYQEKAIVLATQTCYVIFLVSINLGVWDTACQIMTKVEEYFAGIISNKALILWKDLSESIIGPSVKAIKAKLESYPNFEFISPMHYNENNILKLTIEGAFVKGSTNCEAFERMTKYSKLIMRILFRWIFNTRFTEIVAKRFQLQDFGLDSYKIQSVSSIVRFMNDFTECLKNDFFRILHKLSQSRQLLVVDEISKILSSKTSELELRSLIYLSSSDVHLEEMKMDFRAILKPQYFADFIENTIHTRLFTLTKDTNKDTEEKKEKLFGSGVEILRLKSESSNQGNKTSFGLIRFVTVVSVNNDYELVVLLSKSYKKYSLYRLLFNRNRTQDGFRLAKDDTLDSKYGSSLDGEIKPISEVELSTKPTPIKILYKTLFGPKFDHRSIDKFSGSLEDLAFKLFETKEVIQIDQDQVTCIQAHDKYPLLLVALKGGDICVVWTQTLRVISVLHGAKHAIVKIIVSPSGDRILCIDSHANILVWRFNLFSKKQLVQTGYKSGSVVDVTFMNDSSIFAVLTKDNLIYCDLLSGNPELSQVICDANAQTVHFLPSSQLCVLVNQKRRRVWTVDPLDKQIKNETILDKIGEISAVTLNRQCNLICVGTQDGEVTILSSNNLEIVGEYRLFEKDMHTGKLPIILEKKARSIIELLNIEEYLVAVTIGGQVIIVTKV
jgi:hypothetical protein